MVHVWSCWSPRSGAGEPSRLTSGPYAVANGAVVNKNSQYDNRTSKVRKKAKDVRLATRKQYYVPLAQVGTSEGNKDQAEKTAREEEKKNDSHTTEYRTQGARPLCNANGEPNYAFCSIVNVQMSWQVPRRVMDQALSQTGRCFAIPAIFAQPN